MAADIIKSVRNGDLQEKTCPEEIVADNIIK